MCARRTLVPGQKGTKNLLRQYSSQLVCVRYRYDAESRLHFPTVELIIEQASWSLSLPSMTSTTLAGVLGGGRAGTATAGQTVGWQVESGGACLGDVV